MFGHWTMLIRTKGKGRILMYIAGMSSALTANTANLDKSSSSARQESKQINKASRSTLCNHVPASHSSATTCAVAATGCF
jgi:hypothetical protein